MRFNIAGTTLGIAVAAGQFWGATMVSILSHDWFYTGWFGIPTLGLTAAAMYLLLPRNTPQIPVQHNA